jgi:hypothetical protein
LLVHCASEKERRGEGNVRVGALSSIDYVGDEVERISGVMMTSSADPRSTIPCVNKQVWLFCYKMATVLVASGLLLHLPVDR